jgi:hypothetical protein
MFMKGAQVANIGVVVDSDSLVLWRGRDFKWNFDNLDPEGQVLDFPPGELFFEILVGDEKVVWPFDRDHAAVGESAPGRSGNIH